jgi:hypothetical protein
VNALDMLGGFTASAGPIGGAETGSAAEGGAVPGGAFDSLVAKALQGADSDLESDLTDASDEDADPAESGLDLSLMLAMAGLTPFQVTPPIVENGPASVADAATDGVADASTGVGTAIDALPCTLVPAGPTAPAETVAGEQQAASTGVGAAAAEPTEAATSATPTVVDGTKPQMEGALRAAQSAASPTGSVGSTTAVEAPAEPVVEAPSAPAATRPSAARPRGVRRLRSCGTP